MRRACLALLFAACGAPALAQAPAAGEPTLGQPGKDAMWLPTPQVLVEKMLDMAGVTPRDFVIDLGSGDGRSVIAAARRGARALGIEYDRGLVELSRRNAEKEGLAGRAEFVNADVFESDFSEASVITMFLLPDMIARLRPKLLGLRPGTRIVSNSFDMGDWQADETATLTSDASCSAYYYCTALLWIVPVRAAGAYRTPHGELILEQEFQVLSGALNAGGRSAAIAGRVRGEDISFTADGREYRARLNGGVLELQ